MNLLKKQLTTVPALKSINYYKNADDIIFIINVSDYRWKAVLMQYAAGLKQKWHPIRYESRVWSPQEAVYNAG